VFVPLVVSALSLWLWKTFPAIILYCIGAACGVLTALIANADNNSIDQFLSTTNRARAIFVLNLISVACNALQTQRDSNTSPGSSVTPQGASAEQARALDPTDWPAPAQRTWKAIQTACAAVGSGAAAISGVNAGTASTTDPVVLSILGWINAAAHTIAAVHDYIKSPWVDIDGIRETANAVNAASAPQPALAAPPQPPAGVPEKVGSTGRTLRGGPRGTAV
jgi:uncharacterized membrane protein